MTDFGVFVPATALGPQRLSDGTTVLGRLTTTDEQRQEALDWIITQISTTSVPDKEGSATIHWSRGEATVLVVEAVPEKLLGKRVWLADKISERTPTGSEIPQNETIRFRRLESEVTELHAKGMI